MSNERMREWAFVVAGFVVLFWFFTRTASEAVWLWLAFITVMFLPGLLLCRWLLPDWAGWEQALLASFVGFGTGPLLLYYLSVLGIKSVRVPVIMIIAVVCLACIIALEKTQNQPEGG